MIYYKVTKWWHRLQYTKHELDYLDLHNMVFSIEKLPTDFSLNKHEQI